ncbi:MAG: hypothetical protein HY717_11580 [Planctomycetes bacterium]|nr:hypothetical protein [Planctomycetota bacterium]
MRLAAKDNATVLLEGRRWLERFPDSEKHLEAVGIAEYLSPASTPTPRPASRPWRRSAPPP